MFSTKYQQIAEPASPTLPASPTKYAPPKRFMIERHTCTDAAFVFFFAGCMAFTGYIMVYAYENGDPRKIYHGMDWEGKLCGVDLPWKPYVYWCAEDAGAVNSWSTVTSIDLHHPICVEYCPNSQATQSSCYDKSTGTAKLVTDYATHPVANRYCLPQAVNLLDKVNEKLGGHPIEKYIPIVVSTVRVGWPCILCAFGLALLLSFAYLFALEGCASCVMTICLSTLALFPGIYGPTLIYFSFHGGVDGIPSSGDAQTDLLIGIVCCIISCFFLFVFCCMSGAVNRATRSVESAAACMFHAKSILVEPVINLTARIVLWFFMLGGLAWLISVGEVRKTKVYRTFSYTTEESIFLAFYMIMMIWVNDLCNAMSQYAVAHASAKWYFTEHVGGTKLIPNFLLCKAYVSGFLFHFGSLAFGSLVIALTRPFRIILLVLLYAGEVTDNATCGCISKACGCCQSCFESTVMHLSKNAYIEIAITSTGFCEAGKNAAQLLRTENSAIAALTGATWLFTIAGLASVTTFGSFITSFIVQNTEAFNSPTSKYYIQDPMVMTSLAAVTSFFVALCFMLVFDSVADTMLVCLAYDLKDQRENPEVVPKTVIAPAAQQSIFASFFGTTAEPAKEAAAIKRPQYAHEQLSDLLNHK